MIKLKHLIKESLEDMVFSKTIKPRHKKRMELKSTMFPSNPKLTMAPPPTNDSNETRTEIFKLLAYNNGVIDGKMIDKYDNLNISVLVSLLSFVGGGVIVSLGLLGNIVDFSSIRFLCLGLMVLLNTISSKLSFINCFNLIITLLTLTLF